MNQKLIVSLLLAGLGMGARLLWRDGLPLATLVAGEFRPLPGLDAQDLHAAKVALLRDPATGPAQPAGSRPMADPLGLHR